MVGNSPYLDGMSRSLFDCMTILTNRALRPTVGGPAGEAQVARVRRSSTTVHAPGTAHPAQWAMIRRPEEGDRKAGPVSDRRRSLVAPSRERTPSGMAESETIQHGNQR